MLKPPPPQSITELLERAHKIQGLSLQQLAEEKGESTPKTLLRHKGWIGQLLEWHLGANAGSASEPDFINLGIELKTLPVNKNLLPKESTFICSAPHGLNALHQNWETCTVRRKMQRMLWVPVEACPFIPIAERKVLLPILWTMNGPNEAILKQDWEELTEMLHLGQHESLSAALGTYLQIRPKAAHSRILTAMINEKGDISATVPKGFYLRCQFTKKILENKLKNGEYS